MRGGNCGGWGSRRQTARTVLAIAAATLLVVGAGADALAREPLSAESMWALKRLGAPALSPDGRFAVVPVTTFDTGTDARNGDLWLVPTDGGVARQLTADPAAESDPQWSPDGRWIAFVARRGDDKAPQLYVLPTDGGEARQVTTVPTGVSTPRWLPDSKRLVFLTRIWTDLSGWEAQGKRLEERSGSKMTARVWTSAPIAYWDQWLDDREAHIFSVSLDGGEPKPVTPGSGRSVFHRSPGPVPYDVAPDGREIAFVANVDASGIRPNTDVFTIAIEGGTAKNLTAANPASDGQPLYSPDGKYLAFLQQRIVGFYADRTRLMLHDRKAGTTAGVLEEWDRSVDGLVWLPDGSGLLGSIEDAGTRRAYWITLDGAMPQPASQRNDTTDIAAAGRPLTVVALRQSFSAPPDLVRLDPKTGAATKLTDFNDAALANVAFGKVESVTYKGANDADIQMWTVYPPDFDPTKKYPLFLLLHGGPHSGITDGFHWRWNAQVFAGWGYVVAWHNFHGSSGFGQDFTDSITRDWAELPYQDTLKAAEYFAAKPYIDSTRMVAGGGSYGGYLASILLGRQHPFQALIAHAPVYNFYTQEAADAWASLGRYGELWDDPERVKRNSPHYAAGNFKTPTLVIHGQQDLRVPVNHGIELFQTLQKRGVESKLVYFPNENHWVLKPQNSLFWYQTVQDWVGKYAAPDSASTPAATQ